ncbi:MAG: M48 family metalloprotease [Candidatus Thioglobus sp.]|nr:MAG: M48 family metalloprotease [Candidatus Thioglobus sp.]
MFTLQFCRNIIENSAKDSINAFAGPYGYIGVHTGMLLSSDSESELAGVLSHEIAHITQNHLERFSKKSKKRNYFLWAGVLAAVLVKNGEASKAIFTSALAGTLQQSINFTREHEWEADRVGTSMLKKTEFDPQGMAKFFEKLKSGGNAREFLLSHPLSINRIADSLQRTVRSKSISKNESFAYKTIKAKFYYQKNQKIKAEKNQEITYYMQAYQAFSQQKYQNAKVYINKLLQTNTSKSSNILAGRIAAKMGNLELANQYFDKNNSQNDDEASIYYAAKSYLDNRKFALGIATLKPFLRNNQGSYESYKLLANLYLKQGYEGRFHIQSAKALITQGKLEKAIGHYQRAKKIVSSQDLYDVITVRIDDLQQTLDLYEY